MRLYLIGVATLLLLAGCGASPEVPLAPKLSKYATAKQQCSDFLSGKSELTTSIENECDDFLHRLESANETAHELKSGKLKKGEYDQKKILYARQRNKTKLAYAKLSDSIKSATLKAIKADDATRFEKGIAFPGNTFIAPYYEYAKRKAPLFDDNKKYIAYKKKTSKKLMTKAERLLKQGKKKKALVLFTKAAEMGNPQAAREAGLLYEESDADKAMQWHQMAVDEGVKASYLNLGRLYEAKGDKKSALSWYLKSAQQGNANAQLQLYNYYINSDRKEALSWLSKSAQNGNAQAQYTYARILMKEGDTDKAIDLLHQASQQNLTLASDYLGKYYYDLKLYERAFKQLRQSKSANAFYLQAKMFEEGAGRDKDYAQAYTFYARAAALGKKEAKADMQRVNKLLDSEQQRIAEEEEKARKEKMAKMVKQCGLIPTPENITLKNKKFHIIGTASAPAERQSYVIYGADGEDYYVLNARGIKEGDNVDISATSKGSTATLTTSDGDEYEVYQFVFEKPCVLEEEQ